MALLVPAGRFGGLLGSRRLFLFGVTLFTITGTACGLDAGPNGLIGERIIHWIVGPYRRRPCWR